MAKLNRYVVFCGYNEGEGIGGIYDYVAGYDNVNEAINCAKTQLEGQDNVWVHVADMLNEGNTVWEDILKPEW